MEERVQELEVQVKYLQEVRAGSAQGTVELPDSNSVAPERERVVYLQQDRKCPRFCGNMDSADSLPIEEWIEEVENHVQTKRLTGREKAIFVFNHLDGEARIEIKYQSSLVRDDGDEIFSILRELYGSSHSHISLQRKFFNRKQLEGESLLEYSHALMILMDQVKKNNVNTVSNPQVVLRDQFCEGVRDRLLSRELKGLVRQHVNWSLLDVRKEAMRWVTEGDCPTFKSRPKQLPVSSEAKVGVICETAMGEHSELSELKALIAAQQIQLDTITKALAAPKTSSHVDRSNSQAPRFRRAADGQPICIRCNTPGHIARYCPATAPAPRPTHQSGN